MCIVIELDLIRNNPTNQRRLYINPAHIITMRPIIYILLPNGNIDIRPDGNEEGSSIKAAGIEGEIYVRQNIAVIISRIKHARLETGA